MKNISKKFFYSILIIFVFTNTGFTNNNVLPDFTKLVEDNSASIVNISTIRKSNGKASESRPDMPNDELNEFLKKFFGDRGLENPEKGTPRKSHSLGSGFIYSSDGYVITNHHVIAGADQIIVKLNDKRELDAKLIGSDISSDIALLKIKAKNLKPVKIGNSSTLKVGQWVLAIGSPFGFESTVTAGIVSAIGRSLPNDNYVPFIQTDVAINPGNSGGPLFNLKGEVVGINAQIFSRSGGFMGLSFAIPMDVASNVIKQLKMSGKVSRGWLGVYIQEVTNNLAKSFGMKKPKGALISRIIADGPAEKSDLKVGDIILKFDGKNITTSSALPPIVGSTKVGKNVSIEILRNGVKKNIKFIVQELPSKTVISSIEKNSKSITKKILGMSLSNLSSEDKKNLGIDNKYGVIVNEVSTNPAYEAGLLKNDVIYQISGRNILNINEFEKIVNGMKKGDFASLLVRRSQGNSLYLAIKIE
ncbi:MAG: DegQ family serine endoprotease [Gammaproteobacteria bacterium]|jgi:serine protease Do|nr:DegQ family serine endoprotease [Gammaproteobacteria bacterium]MBT7603320.1 DegQ family serine endoprotease [Gammaproteobacteria bacterium]